MAILVQNTLDALVEYAVYDANAPKKLLKYCKNATNHEYLKVVTVNELSSCCLFASSDYKLRTIVDFLSTHWDEIFHTFSIRDESQLHILEGALTKLHMRVLKRNVTGIRNIPLLGRLFTITLQSDFFISPTIGAAIRERSSGAGSCFLSEVPLAGRALGIHAHEPKVTCLQLEAKLQTQIAQLLRGETVEKGVHKYLVTQIQEAFDGKIMPEALQVDLQFAMDLFEASDMAQVTASYSQHICYDAERKQFVSKSNGDSLYTAFARSIKAPNDRVYLIPELRGQAAKEMLLNYKQDPELRALIINAMSGERASLNSAFFVGLYAVSSRFPENCAVNALIAQVSVLLTKQSADSRELKEAITQFISDLIDLLQAQIDAAFLSHATIQTKEGKEALEVAKSNYAEYKKAHEKTEKTIASNDYVKRLQRNHRRLIALQALSGQVEATALAGKMLGLVSFSVQFENELILMPYFYDTPTLHVAIEKYSQRVEKMGTWSGLAEVYALAKTLNCSIFLRKQDERGALEEDRAALDLLPHNDIAVTEVQLDFRDGFV